MGTFRENNVFNRPKYIEWIGKYQAQLVLLASQVGHIVEQHTEPPNRPPSAELSVGEASYLNP